MFPLRNPDLDKNMIIAEFLINRWNVVTGDSSSLPSRAGEPMHRLPLQYRRDFHERSTIRVHPPLSLNAQAPPRSHRCPGGQTVGCHLYRNETCGDRSRRRVQIGPWYKNSKFRKNRYPNSLTLPIEIRSSQCFTVLHTSGQRRRVPESPD